ncbi:AfsR/SARP family transcriptional regulator [Amycolatopsis tolypomycina]|uniref:AfsR/SARP family transcriptional regulator n=1 Tax=Amycolatopsis tolypomycina TaxID=208445 RepID=UPI0033B8786C
MRGEFRVPAKRTAVASRSTWAAAGSGACPGCCCRKAGRLVRVERLLDLLWDGDAPPKARAGSRLRATLDPDGAGSDGIRLLAQDNGYLAEVDPDCIDVHRFRTPAGSARQPTEPAERAGALRCALASWPGSTAARVSHERPQPGEPGTPAALAWPDHPCPDRPALTQRSHDRSSPGNSPFPAGLLLGHASHPDPPRVPPSTSSL